MKSYYRHVRSDRTKWFITAFAFLAIAAVLCGLMTSWYKDFNPFCWFGHKYENGACVRCHIAEKKKTSANGTEIVYMWAPCDDDIVYVMNLEDYGIALYGREDNYISFVDASLTDGTFTIRNIDDAGDGMPGVTKIQADIKVNNQIKHTYTLALDTDGLSNLTEYERGLVIDAVDLIGHNYVARNTSFYIYVTYWLSNYNANDGEYRGVNGISYNANYGPFTINAIVNELPPEPSLPGYTFGGWYLDENFTQPYTDTVVVGDLVLYAKMVPNTYTVVFNNNGGSGTMSSQTFTYDSAQNLYRCSFTKDKYVFKGWSTIANGSVVHTDQKSVKNLTTENGGTVNLYAVWEQKEFTVTFVADGETVTTKSVVVDKSVVLPSAPSKTGYEFVGWYLPNNTKYVDQAITADVTLTAKYEIIRCRVTFVLNGEVYAIYYCDYGTNIYEALNHGTNTLLYTFASDYGTEGYAVTEDQVVEIAKTKVGNVISDEAFRYIVWGGVALGVIIIVAIAAAVIKKVRR